MTTEPRDYDPNELDDLTDLEPDELLEYLTASDDGPMRLAAVVFIIGACALFLLVLFAYVNTGRG